MEHPTNSLVARTGAALLAALPIEPDRVQTHRLLQGSGVTAVGIAMDQGAQMKEHQSRVPILVQVLEGTIAMQIGQERSEMPPGAIMHIEGGVRHALHALAPARVLLLLLDGRER